MKKDEQNQTENFNEETRDPRKRSASRSHKRKNKNLRLRQIIFIAEVLVLAAILIFLFLPSGKKGSTTTADSSSTKTAVSSSQTASTSSSKTVISSSDAAESSSASTVESTTESSSTADSVGVDDGGDPTVNTRKLTTTQIESWINTILENRAKTSEWRFLNDQPYGMSVFMGDDKLVYIEVRQNADDNQHDDHVTEFRINAGGELEEENADRTGYNVIAKYYGGGS